MGKYIVLITLAVGLSLTVLTTQGMQTDQDTSEDQAARQESVLARQIAKSAFGKGLSALRRDYDDWREERSGVPHRNSTFDLSASGPSAGPVALSATGRLGGAVYRITGTVTQQEEISALLNGITAVGPVDFKISGPGCGGVPCVSGLDAGGREDRKGISLPNSGSESDVCSVFDGKVEGLGSGCDVQSRHSNRDVWISGQMGRLEAQIQSKMSSGHPDVTACSSCKFSGNVTRSGILYVTGTATIDGNSRWNGLVYAAQGATVRINGGGGSRNINGGLVMEKDATLDMAGGNRVQYNTDQLRKYLSLLPALSTTAVEVADRTGTLVQHKD